MRTFAKLLICYFVSSLFVSVFDVIRFGLKTYFDDRGDLLGAIDI